MESIIQRAADLANDLQAQYNTEVAEFNQLMDELDSRNAEIERINGLLVQYRAGIEEKKALLDKQHFVIEKSVEAKKKDDARIKALEAQLKELTALNPKRLNKVNKELQRKNAELKTSNEAFKQQRNEAVKDVQKLRKELNSAKPKAFHVDEDGNWLRIIPDLYISKENEFDGVAGTPVIEFFHMKSGITRQGVLCTDGKIGWSSAKNSMPSETMSLIALQAFEDFCKLRKIKMPKPKLKEAA